MEELTDVQERILAEIDKEIKRIDKVLKKVQPYIDEKQRLQATRRTLLSERRTTSGGGHPGVKITLEEVVNWLRENGPAEPAAIAEGLSVDGTVIRSHLNRYKETRYERTPEGWILRGEDDDDDD